MYIDINRSQDELSSRNEVHYKNGFTLLLLSSAADIPTIRSIIRQHRLVKICPVKVNDELFLRKTQKH